MKTTLKSKPLKRLTKINREVLPEGTPEDYEIEYVDISNVTGMGRILGTEKMPFGKAPSRARRLVRSGDTIISTVRTYLRAITTIQDPPPNLVVSTGFATLTPGSEIDGGYFAYLAQTEHFIHEVVSRSTGVSYPAITPTELGNIHISYPPLPLQRRIAAHLDRETGRIDALVAEKEALLRLLEEKRASLISHAVTRGLNPKAKLKPSGIPWLGDVPEHWSVQPLKRLTTTIKTGTTPNTDDVTAEGDFDWYTPGDFGNDIHLSPSKRRIFRDSPSFDSLRIFPAGTILFVGIGATLGKCSVSKAPCSANQQINAIVPTRETDSVFLCLSLRAQAEGIRLMANASTIGILNQERTSAIPIAVPPPDEQRAIAAECLRISSATDTVITDIQTSIQLLREKRTSLISAAVTGEMAIS